MTARTQSLIPLRFKLIAGVVAFMVLAANFNGGEKNPDTSDLNRFRSASIRVTWTSAHNTRPTVDFIYRVGTNNGQDSSKSSPFVATGPTERDTPIAMFASVKVLDHDWVGVWTCQAYVDGNPIHTDTQLEVGKWIRCWAIVTW